MDLFYPEFIVQLGKYSFNRGVKMNACSSQSSYFDWAKIIFTEAFPQNISLQKREEANIYLGYDGAFSKVFEGYIAHDFTSAASINEVLLRDESIKLESTMISHAFKDCQPHEIVSYCCNQAGISKTNISTEQYYQKSYTVLGETALKAIQSIDTNWNISSRFFMQEGVFHWNVSPTQSKIYEFIEAQNIISLSRQDACWVIETVSVPFVKHSNKIAVTHSLVSGLFEVYKIMFETNEAGFLRTRLYFKE